MTAADRARVADIDITTATTAPDEELWERRAKALMLRHAGLTYTVIGERLGISAAVARKDVRAALREVTADTKADMVARQRSILLDLTRAHYAAAIDGDIDATKMVLSTLDHEMRLLGLAAPTQVSVGVSDEDFARRAASLIASLDLEPPRSLLSTAGIAADAHAATDAITAEVISCHDDADAAVDAAVDAAIEGDDADAASEGDDAADTAQGRVRDNAADDDIDAVEGDDADADVATSSVGTERGQAQGIQGDGDNDGEPDYIRDRDGARWSNL